MRRTGGRGCGSGEMGWWCGVNGEMRRAEEEEEVVALGRRLLSGEVSCAENYENSA